MEIAQESNTQVSRKGEVARARSLVCFFNMCKVIVKRNQLFCTSAGGRTKNN